MTKKKPKDLARYGRRSDAVRVFLAKQQTLVRVQHRADGVVKLTRSWPNTPSGKQSALRFAEAYWGERTSPTVERHDLSLVEVWKAFETDQFPHLRPKTRILYREHWQLWMDHFGALSMISTTTPLSPGQYRRMREERGLAVRTIRNELGTVRTVYRWAKAHRILADNPLAEFIFKVSKEQRPTSPGEYAKAELLRILAELNPRKATQWRAWVALVLGAQQGARPNAVHHVRVPDDVQLGHADANGQWVQGWITWRAPYDKTGTEWKQPLRYMAQMAIEIALEWHDRIGYTGGWLLPVVQEARAKGEIYAPGSAWWALQEAERRAGVEKKKHRAAHALRRLLAGDVWEETGDALLAIRAIGDKDPKRMNEYLKDRDHRMTETFTALDQGGVTLHATTKVEVHPCPSCGREFATYNALNAHYGRSHGGRRLPAKETQ